MKAELVLPSFAKINLILRVIGKRPDRYHEIFTVFQTVSLHDTLTISSSDQITIECDRQGIPTDERNLIFKAIRALQVRFGKNLGVKVVLTKNIPSPGGLGGGSSNAAAALIGVSRLWGLDYGIDDLKEIGVEIGADVPFFLHGGTAIGTGTGTAVESVDDFQFEHIIVASPGVEVSTPEAYRALSSPDLTTNVPKRILKNYRKEAEALYKGHFEPLNDFETVIFEIFPEIKNTADILKKSGASAVSLSGSGPSVFGFFDGKSEMETAAAQVREIENVSCFPVRTISGKSYRERLGFDSS